MHHAVMRTLSAQGLALLLFSVAGIMEGCTPYTTTPGPCSLVACVSPAACGVVNGKAACTCPAGQVLATDKLSCQPDPCTTGNGSCDTNATCDGASGVAVCTCKTGYQGSGKSCTEVDECASGVAVCDWKDGATCTNTPGSYKCTCPSGYTGDGVTTCTSIDYCGMMPGPAGCPARRPA